MKIIEENFIYFFIPTLFIIIGIINEIHQYISQLPGFKQKNKHISIYRVLKYAEKRHAQGIVFGSLLNTSGKKVFFSPSEDEGHILCVGGSGMGKTSALLIPTLQSWCASNIANSSCVIDISGDIAPNVDMPKKLIYCPSDKYSTPYDIFSTIDCLDSDSDKEKALAELSILIMPDVPNASDAEKYYTSEGRKILTASLIAFYFEGLDFIDICKKIINENWKVLLNNIDRTHNENAILYINSFEGVDERYNAAAKQTCDAAISLFATDKTLSCNIRRARSGEPFFSAHMIENHNCFIQIPEASLEYYTLLTQILTSQCLSYFKNRDLNADHQILFCLDEAASLGQIDIIPALRRFRKRKVRIFMLTQSLADIDLTWGQGAEKSMITNFKYKIVLESSLPDEQEFWSRLVGKKTLVHKGSSYGSETNSFSQNEFEDWIITPNTLANLGDTLLLLFPGGFKILKKNYYYK